MRFDSVWDAVADTAQEAASLRARSALMIELQEHLKRLGATQAQAAQALGVTQPRVSDLMRGKIERFNVEALMDMAAAAGLHVELEVRHQSGKRTQAGASPSARQARVSRERAAALPATAPGKKKTASATARRRPKK